MIVLDHNITREQADLLARSRVRFRRIGVEIGLPSWDDEQEILRHLHRSKQATFFTRDLGFFRYRFCHRNYCLVVIEMAEVDAASSIILRFLRHPAFKTKSQRSGVGRDFASKSLNKFLHDGFAKRYGCTRSKKQNDRGSRNDWV